MRIPLAKRPSSAGAADAERADQDEPARDADFDPYHRWLGIPLKEQPPHHYRLLGIGLFEDDPEVIRDAAARQMAHVRTYQLGQHAELSQKILNELAAAKASLLDAEQQAAYNAKLRGRMHSPVSEAEAELESGPAAPRGEVAVVPELHIEASRDLTRHGDQQWKPPIQLWIAVGAAAVLVLLAVVIRLTTRNGTVKITLSDSSANVDLRVDGDTIDVTGLDQPLRLRTGKHELTVTGEGYQTVCRSFTVHQQGNPVLHVELVPAAPPSQAAAPEARATPAQ